MGDHPVVFYLLWKNVNVPWTKNGRIYELFSALLQLLCQKKVYYVVLPVMYGRSVFMNSFYLGLGLFFLYSFLGWLAEVAFSAVSRKKFINTGFLTGPICPIYGVGILFILHFLEPLRDNLFFLFVGSTVVATVLEYVTNRLLEGLTGTKWWDYSRFRFHFGGYVCLAFSAFWGVGAVVIVRWVNPLVVRLLSLIPATIGKVILLGLVILLVLDLIATAGAILRMRHQFIHDGEEPTALQQAASLPGQLSEAILGRIQRRVERTVPKLSQHEEAAQAFRDRQEAASNVFAYGCGFYKLIWLFAIGALLGDLIETLYCRVTAGVWMSRSSVLYGPFSIVWGLGAVLMTVMLERLRNRDSLAVFLSGAVLGGVYEYVCSVFTEVMFGTIFWDYSGFKFNLGGRINLLYCFFWGMAAVVWIKGVYPFLSSWIERIPIKVGRIATWVFVVFMSVNIVISGLAMDRYSKRASGVDTPPTALSTFLDEHYPDERMKKVYPNAVHTD